MKRFPFGRPVEARSPARARRGLFVLGAYPSALHVRWSAPDGTTVAALAVDDEPVPFWDGAGQEAHVEAWEAAVGFREEWGRIEPAGPANGSSGRWVEARVLAPLRARREDAWITDCLDTYRASTPQAKAIRERFAPFARAHGIEVPELGKHPSEDAIVREATRQHIDRLRDELRAAAPATIVTLGNAALRVMCTLVEGYPCSEQRLYRDGYGLRLPVSFEGRPVPWYALAHPGTQGDVRHAHDGWVQRRSSEVVGARRRCPACGTRGLVPIVFGHPPPGAWEQVRLGRLVVGGCDVTYDDPAHECIECGSRSWPDGRWEPPERW